jgi:hypothetical protein
VRHESERQRTVRAVARNQKGADQWRQPGMSSTVRDLYRSTRAVRQAHRVGRRELRRIGGRR